MAQAMASSYVDGGASSSGLEEVWVPPWKGELGSLSVQGWVVKTLALSISTSLVAW